MGGSLVNAKYIIIANFEIEGVAEKSDIIGAIFGQTEGLLGDDLDLRELQKIGKLGRIDVDYEIKEGKTYGSIIIPTNLDKPEVALISASLEIIDKVGPNSAKVKLREIKDAREEKRKKVIERAKEILKNWKEAREVNSEEIIKEIAESIKISQLIKYGEEKLTAGPDIDTSQEIIIVEGRADVINMLKHGYKNVIALNGAKIPQTIIKLSKNKKIIAFVDGDRAGDLILKELLQLVKVDYIARAPFGKEVEELTNKEIIHALENKITTQEYLRKLKIEKKYATQTIFELIKSIVGTMEAILLNENQEILERVAVKDLLEVIKRYNNFSTLILDGIITQRLINIAKEKNVHAIYGYKIGNISYIPHNMVIYTFNEQGIIEKYEIKT